ncbi:AAA family ATPase [Clostridium sp.]|uniref:AAA family ATPase n=1 Tax=Clostridium sp. TaxID=1506 RepID=UPI001A416672|nr:AAA family ATPase [Clostridium sp.]MBK5242149.1 AAA family ATPase [Clostridium sp.]
MSRIQKAKREAIYTKVLLGGCSGSGKTFSALRMATGMAKELSKVTGKEERICYIDTENRRSCYYAKKFDYDILELDKFAPEEYIEAIDDALDSDYHIIVLDTVSLEWQFLLDVHNRMPGNSFVNFNKISPRHDKFLDKILQSNAHFIVCCRSKEKYVLEEQNGKQIPVKKGVDLIQRDGIEYIMTVSLNVDMSTHTYTSMKDNTELFEYGGNMVTEIDGANIIKWANDGDLDEKYSKLEKAKEEGKAKIALNEKEEVKKIIEEKEKKTKTQKITPPEVKEEIKTDVPKSTKTLEEVKNEVIARCKILVMAKKKSIVASTIAKINGEDPNPLNIKDISIAEKVLAALKEIKEK